MKLKSANEYRLLLYIYILLYVSIALFGLERKYLWCVATSSGIKYP